MSIELVMPSNQLILCHPLLLPPSIFPSIRVFSNESVLHIRWPKDWNFSFSISPSSEHSGLISFRIDWLDSLQSKGLSRVFSNTAVQKHQFVSIIKIYFKFCSSSPRTLHEIMQYFSSLSMPMSHLEIVWNIETRGPRSGCNQAFSIFPSHLRWLFRWWSSEHISSNTDDSYRAHNAVPGTYKLLFLFFLSHFLFFLKCLPTPPHPSAISCLHVLGTAWPWSTLRVLVSRSHWTTKEALVAGRNAEMQTLFLPTSPRTSFLNSSLIPSVVVEAPILFFLFSPYLMTPL